MSTKNRAIGDTEDEFQAALVTYTKAGNKTAAMRRLWNAAYEMGRSAAEAATPAILVANATMVEPVKEKKSKQIEQAKQAGFEEGRQSGFEEGRQFGEKEATSGDKVALSFAAGKTAGLATGMEMGREAEAQRWKEGGHSEDGTCRTFDGTPTVSLADSDVPTRPSLDDAGATKVFSWADDADFLPIQTIYTTTRPRDFSGLRSGSTNPFDTLQRRHARSQGSHTSRRRQPRLQRSHCAHHPPLLLDRPRYGHDSSSRGARSIPTTGTSQFWGFWHGFWMMVHGPPQGCVDSG
ncbi:hypothetical protein FB451DRAFT_1358540 [Mycena latifolia]|nr:hypothetical protein FB451DRAFT_1358540 [Mycena latifolia]